MNKYITFRNFFYIPEKVRNMFPLLDDNADYNSWPEKILIYGIDDEIGLDDDLAN